jgi:hypothetical protein
MASAATFFTRVLADIFPGKPARSTPTSPTPAAAVSTPAGTATASSATSADSLRVIGQGAANETHMTIAGVPTLFVDEGDRIVQFEPAFDEQTQETSFGLKILPDLAPHWSQKVVHQCALKEAIVIAIRSAGQPVIKAASEPATPTAASRTAIESGRAADVGSQAISEQPRSRTRHEAGDSSPVTGRILSWGEEKFPRRNGDGPRFYSSFAIHILSTTGERTLQGEGLKDAIAESRCEIGNVVSVRRLSKIKVQAFDSTGAPKMRDGKPVMWDKWLWSITK